MQSQSQPTSKVIVVMFLRIQNKQEGMCQDFHNPSTFYDGLRETSQSHLTGFQIMPENLIPQSLPTVVIKKGINLQINPIYKAR